MKLPDHLNAVMSCLSRAYDRHREADPSADRLEIRFEMFRHLVAEIPNPIPRCADVRHRRRVLAGVLSSQIRPGVRRATSTSPQKRPYTAASTFVFRSRRPSSRHHINPHCPTFSIVCRVRRRHQRLPTSLVIENADFGNTIGFGFEAFPINANDYTGFGAEGLIRNPLRMPLDPEYWRKWNPDPSTSMSCPYDFATSFTTYKPG